MKDNNFVILCPTTNLGDMKLKKASIFITLLTVLAFSSSLTAHANTSSNESRKIFDYTYNLVFGPQGSSLSYNVNIIGIMNVSGSIWHKNKKKRYSESRYMSWNDGQKEYYVDNKKKTVSLYIAGTRKSERYGNNFTFHPDDYTYSHKETQTTYELTIDARKEVSGIKHMIAIIDKRTHAPKYLKIKVLWFWTTVSITNFRSGISDDVFIFPSEKFKSYTFIDRRKD